jgi:hypothetical protein
MFHADGRTDRQTDMTKLIVAFCSFANALKLEKCIHNISVYTVLRTANYSDRLIVEFLRYARRMLGQSPRIGRDVAV